jgi:hypothetical protein
MTHFSKNLKSIIKTAPDRGLPFLYLALPVMDEPEFLQRLLECIRRQSYTRFRLFVCVNQPESYRNDPGKSAVCRHNAESLQFLKGFTGIDIEIIDRSSGGRGWTGKRHGIGYARKTLMDCINTIAAPGDVIVSMDADTIFSDDYLLSVARTFSEHPGIAALSVPYFHHTPADSATARAMLRYEIYMRYYFLNLNRIGSPYAFTALGSAMALPVSAYRAIGGMTPKLSGEDFYFLQKLRKYGRVLSCTGGIVYPEARFSDRVFFGTGPAMIKGAAGDWSSYPIYPVKFFDEISEIYQLLPVLYKETVKSKAGCFMSEIFREEDPFQPLRLNHTDLEHFKRAFHEKFDGLRILQYLKAADEKNHIPDEENLLEFLYRFYTPGELEKHHIPTRTFSFQRSPLELLESVRMFLFEKEREARVNSVCA